VDPARLNGSSGFRLDGADGGDQAGFSVSEAGDVNGDGIDDLLVGAPYADPENRSSAGEVYVVFGKKSGYKSTWDLDSLTDSEGFVIQGIDPNDYAGHAVNTAGDVNNDGYDDIIIGAPGAASKKGETYVLFGGDFTGDSTVSSASADDALSVSSSGLVGDEAEPRDNPLTSGDAVTRVWTGKDDFCIEYPPQTPSYRGDGSDLLTANPIDMLDHDGDQEE
ncbi:MAG: integrin alpha, partial [Planctomycetota bacterium]|nr:integrin alpha [Planctomycetota bacterium]